MSKHQGKRSTAPSKSVKSQTADITVSKGGKASMGKAETSAPIKAEHTKKMGAS